MVKSLLSMRVKLRDGFILLLHLAAAPRPGGSAGRGNTARQEEPWGPPYPVRSPVRPGTRFR